ncbi:uncharacterized protein TNCV_1858681 [Trichonephila clavipes]|nr:uncharacterized protein TNCV_1858681 [Trichonephila clavipes]
MSAARVITVLKYSYPSNIVLFKADLQPILFCRQAGLVKYFNKFSVFGQQNQTSMYLNSWVNRQRLKKNSLFSQVESQNFLTGEVEPSFIQCSLNLSGGFSRVYFHFNLSLPVIKNNLVSSHLRHLALGIINNIPNDAIKIYADGNRQVTRQVVVSKSLRTRKNCL